MAYINDHYRAALQNNVAFHNILEFDGHLGSILVHKDDNDPSMMVGLPVQSQAHRRYRVLFSVSTSPLSMIEDKKRCSLFDTAKETQLPVSSVDCSCNGGTSMVVFETKMI